MCKVIADDRHLLNIVLDLFWDLAKTKQSVKLLL